MLPCAYCHATAVLLVVAGEFEMVVCEEHSETGYGAARRTGVSPRFAWIRTRLVFGTRAE